MPNEFSDLDEDEFELAWKQAQDANDWDILTRMQQAGDESTGNPGLPEKITPNAKDVR